MEQQIRILCVDDEVNVLKSLQRIFLDDPYEILTAGSGMEGLDVLERNPGTQIVISDYRMPEMNGVDFLQQVCRKWPDTVRIVLSGYADTAAIVAAINEGGIYKFIPKPWNDDELKITINNAIEKYYLQIRNRELAEELQVKNEELNRINYNLERIVAEKTHKVMRQNRILAMDHNILDVLPVAVISLDPSGMVTHCNRLGQEMFGRGGGDIVGRNAGELFSEEVRRFMQGLTVDRESTADISVGDCVFRVRGRLVREENRDDMVLVFCCGVDRGE